MPHHNYKSDMSIDEKVMMAIVRAADGFKKDSSSIFRKWGLTFSQYNALRVLDASENGQNTMRNVHRIMLVSSANMSGIAKRLEKGGFVVRTAYPDDDRLKTLQITPAGVQVLRDIHDLKERNLKRYLMKYSDSQKSEILETLRYVLQQTRDTSSSERL